MDSRGDAEPIIITRELFIRIRRIAGRANMAADELIELALSGMFDSAEMSSETLSAMIKQLPDEL